MFCPTAVGDLVITATAANSAGVSTPARKLLTVHPAPAVPAAPTALAANPETANVGQKVTITGKAEKNSAVTVTATPGDKTCMATANDAGDFSCELSFAAPTAPAAPTNLAVNPNPAITGERATISGKAEANSNVKVTAGAASCDTVANASNDFACDITPTASGPVNVTATNAVGTSTPATLQVTVKDLEVAPAAPEVTLSASSAKVGETVTANIKTTPNTKLTVTGTSAAAQETRADANGNLAYPFTPTTAGATTISVVASNNAGSSPATKKTVQVTALPQGEAAISVNPGAPVAGQGVDLTVSGADANTRVVISAGGTQICAVDTDANGSAHCQWRPTAGTYTLTITTTVDGAEKVITKPVTVTEPVVDPGPGGENPGGETPGGDGGDGSLGSLSSLFGSLGG